MFWKPFFPSQKKKKKIFWNIFAFTLDKIWFSLFRFIPHNFLILKSRKTLKLSYNKCMSNATDTNYFKTFLQITDVANSY